MTETEEKVNELTNKLIDIINEMQKREMEDKVIVQAIKSYLTWHIYVWNNNLPSIVLENEICSVACPPISAYLTIKNANEAFDKITG